MARARINKPCWRRARVCSAPNIPRRSWRAATWRIHYLQAATLRAHARISKPRWRHLNEGGYIMASGGRSSSVAATTTKRPSLPRSACASGARSLADVPQHPEPRRRSRAERHRDCGDRREARPGHARGQLEHSDQGADRQQAHHTLGQRVPTVASAAVVNLFRDVNGVEVVCEPTEIVELVDVTGPNC
jgi:hypothetical protein